MRHGLLETAIVAFVPAVVLFAFVVLLRGHHEPGGGFVGGVLAGAALCLHAIVISPRRTRRLLPVSDRVQTAVGLLLALAAGLVGPLRGDPLFTAYWTEIPLPGEDAAVAVGTPMLFELGVFLTVFGAVQIVLFALGEER